MAVAGLELTYFESKVIAMPRRSYSANCPLQLVSAFSLFFFASFVAAQTTAHLLPVPREAHFDVPVELPAKIVVSVPVHNEADEFAAHDLEDAVKQMAVKTPGEEAQSAAVKPPYRVVLLRIDSAAAKAVLARQGLSFDPAMESEGYVLVLNGQGASDRKSVV